MAKAKKTKAGSWRIQLYLGRDPNGKQIIKSITAPTKREAEAKALEAEGRLLILAPDAIDGLKTLSQDHKKLEALYRKGRRDAERIPDFLNGSQNGTYPQETEKRE